MPHRPRLNAVQEGDLLVALPGLTAIPADSVVRVFRDETGALAVQTIVGAMPLVRFATADGELDLFRRPHGDDA